ncbi:hypothetical protein J4218_01480 [Candidatus Pacearchaeota archaeon]|nr:hypothetical protein [Candidatus Pacearchaeota archaeon]
MKNDFNTKQIILLLFFNIFLFAFLVQILAVEEQSFISGAIGTKLGFTNDNEVVLENVVMSFIDQSLDVKTVSFGGGASSIKFNNQEFKNLNGVNSFSFKDKKLVSAKFNVSKDSEYIFGNKKVKIPKDSQVIFKDNKVSIQLPKDYSSAVEKPVKIPDSKDPDVNVEYRYADDVNKIKIKDNGKEYEISKLGNEKFQLNYDGKADAFYVNGKFEMKGLRVGEKSQNDEKTYLFFDGKEHEIDSTYLSLGDKKLIIGAAKGDYSPSVQFLPGNEFLKVTDKNLVMMQKIGGKDGGYLTIEQGATGNIPKVTSKGGGYNMFFGEKAIRYNEELKDKYKGPMLLTKNPLADYAKVKESIPMQIITTDKTGNRVGEWDAVFDSYNGIKAGNAKELENQLATSKQGVVTSIKTSFHSLTKEEQEKLKSLTPEKQRELVGSDVNKLREEIKKIPAEVKVEPVKPDTKLGNGTVIPFNKTTNNSNQPTKGDKLKDSEKKTYKDAVTKSGIKYPTQQSFNGVYGELTLPNGEKVKGYVFNGQFQVNTNSWGNIKVEQIAVVNNDIYINRKTDCTSPSKCNYAWEKYKSIK